MRNQIRTVTDLLLAASEALDNKDRETLEDLIEVVESWCISGAEGVAYQAVLGSMIDAIGQMTE